MNWWEGTIAYEVYVRSFADSDGDGVGDLLGVRSRLGHIASLGVDLVWLTPFYPSPQADHGYDIEDHTDVDPVYGTLADVDAVVADAHQRGLRVMVDVVANHTSDRHPWFQASRSSRDHPKRGWYVWRDPASDGGPPNNWVSYFGGPAWTFDEATGQYYLHLFLPEQPDLNWREPAVVDAFDGILRFWLDRGVDGFRIDVAHGLLKDERFLDNPPRPVAPGDDEDRGARSAWDAFDAFEHLHDMNQPGVLDVYRRWRQLVEPYGAVLLGEVYLLDPIETARYVRDQDGLHLALYVPATRVGWDADEIRQVAHDGVRHGGGRFAWPLSSHDDRRAPTRFGGGGSGRERALAYLTLVLWLPGVVLLFQGDELALEDGRVPPERQRDPVATRNPGQGEGRDGARTPMPWDPDGPHLGFTTGRPWLPLGGREPSDTVAVQHGDPRSYLHRVRTVLTLRRRCRPEGSATVDWLTERGPLVAYQRGVHVVVANCGDRAHRLELPPGQWRMVYRSDLGGIGERLDGRAVSVPPDAALVLRVGDVSGS